MLTLAPLNSVETTAAVTAAVTAMNAWEAEGRALRAEAEALYGDERQAALQSVRDRNWWDVASDFARWEDSDAISARVQPIEFRVADAPEWLVYYNDQTGEWVAVHSPPEEE